MIKQTIKIHLCPNSSRNAICGKYNEEYIKIAIKEKPIDGKANEALIKFLSKELNITKSQIKIIKGLTGRDKTIEINSTENILQKLSNFF